MRVIKNNVQDKLKQNKSLKPLSEVPVKWNKENVVYLRDFLQMFSQPSRDRNVQPIIFFHQYLTLHNDGSATLAVDTKDVELYRTECKKQGIVFVYLGDRFMKEYEEKNLLSYGFWNTFPNSGHLNKDGHRMIADELCKVIEQLEVQEQDKIQ